MFDTLPQSALDSLDWKAEQLQPYLDDLLARPLTSENVEAWLEDWSALTKVVYEIYTRLSVATSVDTTDAAAEARMNAFLDNIYPALMLGMNALNQKLLTSGLKPAGFELPLRKIQVDAELFREENIPLSAEVNRLNIEFDKIIGAQTVTWNGEEKTLAQMQPLLQEPDRSVREKAWRLMIERSLHDRDTLNNLWVKYMALREQIAANADTPDFRAYMWKSMKRFDYTPQDAETFHRAIEEVVVPAAKRLYERQQTRLKLDTLRPWDVGGGPMGVKLDPQGREPIRPYETVEQLETTLETIFNRVDPALGGYYRTMVDEKLLDLDNRKGKAPGGYCTTFYQAQRPFIFMNAVGLHEDVQTLLHEGGHAFHAFESFALPYIQQQDVPMEFAEVASMSMELLAAPYLTKEQGGFYTPEDAARARAEHLENLIRFWPYMAVVDAFQHWVYTNHKAASDPANCDAKWAELWDRFIQGIDYSGDPLLATAKETGWHRKLHIFQNPFYYIEYGLAQLGAVQVWKNALSDQAKAVADYRKALALGGTTNLPGLFGAAGAKFGFDAPLMKEAVDLVERTLEELDPA
jgi:oligoendopeptidase F